MCGIVGLVEVGEADEHRLSYIVDQMAAALLHRGPDGGGVWVDAWAGVALGSRRLAIVDLSPAGHQPMVSASGRYTIVFNGEIYNHRDIRRNLLAGSGAPRFRGDSDTETLLAAIERWGLRSAIEQSVGMFALAVWDRRERTLVLARDRLGEKPLYYGWVGRTFLFGSELKALRVHPDWKGTINRDAIVPYLRYQYIPAPLTIYEGIRKLPAGSILTWRVSELGPSLDLETYWSARDVVTGGVERGTDLSAEAAADRLEWLIFESVRRQMIADVPLGALLSGGIDSSMIVAAMRAQSERPVRTFTIGFREAGFDEAGFARAVARHLGTDHTELYVTASEARSVIPELPMLYDEPFADASQIPTAMLCRLARRDVTVALSGDGGDEVFGGYTRYRYLPRFDAIARRVPRPLRVLAGRTLTAPGPARWDRLAELLASILPRRDRIRPPGERIHRVGSALAINAAEELHCRLETDWPDANTLVVGANSEIARFVGDAWLVDGLDLRQSLMYRDLVSYLPDNVLVKSDRASMGTSLEVRSPFLDHRLVEFAWTLPTDWKIRGGEGKWILRQVLARYVPRELTDRPKQGFVVPIGAWLRGPLRDWAEDLLDERRLREEGFFHPGPIRDAWQEHLTGERDRQRRLWDILMFQAWLNEEPSRAGMAQERIASS